MLFACAWLAVLAPARAQESAVLKVRRCMLKKTPHLQYLTSQHLTPPAAVHHKHYTVLQQQRHDAPSRPLLLPLPGAPAVQFNARFTPLYYLA